MTRVQTDLGYQMRILSCHPGLAAILTRPHRFFTPVTGSAILPGLFQGVWALDAQKKTLFLSDRAAARRRSIFPLGGASSRGMGGIPIGIPRQLADFVKLGVSAVLCLSRTETSEALDFVTS